MKCLVIKSTGSWHTVKAEGGQIYECKLRGNFRTRGIKSTNPVVVGDRVSVVDSKGTYVIDNVYERTNCIVRRSVNLSKKTHVIASNIDQAILIITMNQPVTTTAFIDRFLVSANAFGVNVVLLFNKIDLYDLNLLKTHKEYIDMYEKIGYKCISTSVLNNELDEIKSVMKNKINIISGHSGVGKSTLINMIQPDLSISTQDISLSHNQGQHTTTFSQLYDMDFGASIIDTPGIKGFGLVEIEKNDICNFFPEFLNLRSKCKFNNCFHNNEPNCEIKEAVLRNEISESRYKNYLSMYNEDDNEYRINNY
ncbi:MAG: ribosome small subunit-dependent GTPase A [Flavobacteriales bacterium]|nr:ribosome small subunit-dependent GTPase A [Flavobacteriales bacterium]|tara:strand:+ start:437 stop:1363 length:927 start_codon:yes stop_codon:yes gene_type:complete